jgi:glycine cleavage system H lipoate-binding protein
MTDIVAAGRATGSVELVEAAADADTQVQGGISATSYELGEPPVKTPRN